MSVTDSAPKLEVRPDAPSPTETPECEASTCHGISTAERVELHDAWPGWFPLLIITVMVVCAVGFMIGRILSV
ncbi:hypothetical protein [Saccharothrix sp. ST-888]|uniref:hypothetical protein n=1 Tax=Saccharothrix sp. ST-888 TaxID=1427391 RepID=UPI0005ECBFA6|nr:hypothetical protein [Saccharothrix sp. ST-888]KJK59320.1 hypothetical protein UK12_04655 [Saccharothrix sp. ST-888]